MEITEVETIPVNMGIVDVEDGGIAPYVTNHSEVTDVNCILVRVDTDEGVTGWGEMREFISPRVTKSVIDEGIGPVVEGHSPFEVESLRRLISDGYTDVDMFVSPVEIACWDIVGKTVGKPLYELLGGWTAPEHTDREVEIPTDRTPSVEIAYCAGILSPEESRTHAERAVENGHNVLKTKAGRDWRQDVERIAAMDDAADGQLEFRLDPNQGWRLDEAVRIGAALQDEGIYLQYMEQPIRTDTHESMATLRERLNQPIAPNEDMYISHSLREMAEAGALDVAVVDMTPLGGISGLRQTAAVAEDAAIPMAHHCSFDLGIRTSAIVHACAGIPGFSLPPDSTYYAWEDDVIEEPLTVTDGEIEVPDDPGLGVTVDESKLDEYRVELA